jgi:hypothetical protein
MKIDPHKSKEKYLNWKKRNKDRIKGISKKNSDIILKYLKDMETGLNISNVSVKGPRSYSRLNSLSQRLVFFAQKFEELYGLNNITNAKEEQVITFFSNMKKGHITKTNNRPYKSADTYAKIFKAFWHWHQKVSRKQEKKFRNKYTAMLKGLLKVLL